MDVSWWLLVVLAQVTQLTLCDTEVTSQDIAVTLNTLRPISQTSERFLGISISPKQLLNNGGYSVATLNMLKALTPGYLRVGSSDSDNLSFKIPTNSSDALLISESQWVSVNQLAADTGLHLIFSLSPKSWTQGELLRFSDARGYDITWQLGYNLTQLKHSGSKTNETKIPSGESAQELSKLRRLIDSFPRYQNTAVLSPDLEFCEESKCLEEFKDFLQKTSDDFDVIVLQMKPQDSIQNIRSMFESLEKHSIEFDKFSFKKDNILQTTKIHLKKNIWIVEGERTHSESGEEMSEAMSCTMSLGLTSQLGYNTFLLHLPQLSQPSPSYWVALLYRALVGPAVLRTRKWPQAANAAVFAACTGTERRTALDTEWEYDTGAVTMWGTNPAEKSLRVSPRVGWRVDRVHLYVVTCDDSGRILLNGQPLRIVHGVLPRLSPHIRSLTRSMTVTVPPQSVFFVVLPDAQAPACFMNARETFANTLKNEDTPLVLNIPITQTKSNSDSLKIGMKSSGVDIEKGGIFTDAEDKNVFSNHQRTEDKSTDKKNIQTSYSITKNHPEIKLEQNKIQINGKEDAANDSYNKENNHMKPNGSNSNDDIRKYEHYPSTTAQTIYSGKQFNFSSQVLARQNEVPQSMNDSNVSDNSALNSIEKTSKINQTFETKVQRVKRSHDYGYYEESMERNTETSPLYRRVNLLRRILQKMQQPIQYEDGHEQQNLRGLTSTIETTDDKNTENNWEPSKPYDMFPFGISSTETKGKGQIPTIEQNKEVENINYLPGEFYKILGGLKIDSNTSLKDKEDIDDIADSVEKQLKLQNCNDDQSKLTVTKKPDNDPQEDQRLVESATENSKKYYVLQNKTAEQQIKTKQFEDFDQMKFNLKNIEFSRTMSDKDMSRNNEQTKPHQGKFFQEVKKEDDDSLSNRIKLPVGRNKRETIEKEDGFVKFSKHIQENEKINNKLDYSDEVELQGFLEELTNEGEKILKNIDEEYESHIENSTCFVDTKTLVSTEPPSISGKDKTVLKNGEFLPRNKTEEADYYLKNNIVIDKEVKPKRTYPYVQEPKVYSASLDKTTSTITNNGIGNKNKFITSGPTVGFFESHLDYSSSDESTLKTEPKSSNNPYKKAKVTSKGITEGISNSDMFLNSMKLEPDRTTKPGINMANNNKLDTYGANLVNNMSTDFNLQNSNKSDEFLKIDQGTFEDYSDTSQKQKSISSPGIKTETGNLNLIDKDGSILLTKIAYPITTTKIGYLEEKSFDFTNTTNNIPNSIRSKEIYSNDSESKIEVESNNSFANVTGLSNNLANPKIGSISISGVINSTNENISDKKSKINSESKLENKVLPPPSKSTLILHPLPLPSLLTLKRNLTLSKKFNDINNRLSALNKKPELSVPPLGKGSSSTTFLNKNRQERLEAIKEKLQKAREQLLNLTSYRNFQNPLPKIPVKQKREIIENKGILNSLLYGEKENKLEDGSQKSNFYQNTKQKKVSLENLFPINRLKRQSYDDEEMASLSMENNPDQVGDRKYDREEDPKKQPFNNIKTPYYFPEIKKWIIPLSNNTENILYKNKMLHVNLYGIVSDEWAQENVGRSSSTEMTRQRRALQYPCVKDNFNDFETEDENIKPPRNSNVKDRKKNPDQSTNPQSLTEIRKKMPSVVSAKIHPSRSKRANNRDIEMNELEMKALLTNEIVKEKPTNDEPDHENIFSSMLHKTLTKTVTNKTGIERMLELAKQYHETKPSSLEIFSTKTKNKKYQKEFFDKDSEENAAVELIDDKIIDDTPTLRYEQTNSSEVITRNDVEHEYAVKTPGFKGNTSTEHQKSSDSYKEDKNSSDYAWSDFIKKVQEFFESVTGVIKKGIM